MIIYKTTNLLNSKIYIGQSSSNNKYYYGSGVLIKKAIKKYGKQNFERVVLETCLTKDELNKAEVRWIEFFNSRSLEIGYNLGLGGEGAGKHSRETKDKIALIKKGKKRLPFTLETRLKMSNVKKNMTSETKDKMSDAKKNMTKETRDKISKNNGKYWEGKTLTQEHKNKLSLAKRKRNETI